VNEKTVLFIMSSTATVETCLFYNAVKTGNKHNVLSVM